MNHWFSMKALQLLSFSFRIPRRRISRLPSKIKTRETLIRAWTPNISCDKAGDVASILSMQFRRCIKGWDRCMCAVGAYLIKQVILWMNLSRSKHVSKSSMQRDVNENTVNRNLHNKNLSKMLVINKVAFIRQSQIKSSKRLSRMESIAIEVECDLWSRSLKIRPTKISKCYNKSSSSRKPVVESYYSCSWCWVKWTNGSLISSV